MMKLTNRTITLSIVKILSFGADRSIQTEETKVRLLLSNSLIRVCTGAVPSAHLCRHDSLVEQE